MFITIPIKILVNIYRYVFILNTIKIYNHTVIFFFRSKKVYNAILLFVFFLQICSALIGVLQSLIIPTAILDNVEMLNLLKYYEKGHSIYCIHMIHPIM